ncbi:uncharacterized protein LOC106883830 [Octopus bimaculoides]|uniref:Uncharacterized protein n=1 Tax=Octopus bimaculoides TaxID=37653 RepID=A0A0L8I6K5_OCTBM|nr:uncharacterized protein LOC106883830 [Octopus bimaculoides]|eukprot:XP_014790455.1 PREDICTED: uncharacterized protein LOC106883830 [Octopus bimaculoides]
MQFTGIFCLFGAFVCLPTIYASVLRLDEMMKIMSADVEPQGGSVEPIEGLKTVSEVVRDARNYMRNTDAKTLLASQTVPFNCGLAPSLGNLTRKVFQDMDRNVQVLIGTTKSIIEKLIREKGANKLEFGDYLNAMKQNKFIQIPSNGVIRRKKSLSSSYSGISDGRTLTSTAKRIESWFKGDLLNDQDVFEAAEINLEDFKRLVSTTGAAIRSFETFFYVNQYLTREVVNVGILRYPEPKKPYFQMYRIKLSAYKHTERILFIENTSSGISGNFEMYKFVPSKGVIEALDPNYFNRFIASAIGSLGEL